MLHHTAHTDTHSHSFIMGIAKKKKKHGPADRQPIGIPSQMAQISPITYLVTYLLNVSSLADRLFPVDFSSFRDI